MADISTETISEVAAEVPDYPMARAAGCPLAPPPEVLALNAVKPLSRVRIWAVVDHRLRSDTCTVRGFSCQCR